MSGNGGAASWRGTDDEFGPTVGFGELVGARARPQDLSISVARHGDHAPKPGLGNGHHLHPDGARLRVSRCRSRLGDPPGSVVAAVDHDGAFCVETLEDALARHGKPEIFNTAHGSQFTA